MARPVTTLVVFFVAFNLFASMLMASGAAAAIGIDAEVGGDDAVADQTDRSGVDSGSPTGSTLFGMYNVLSGQLSDIFGVIFPGLRMLERAGVPDEITGLFLGPLFSLFIVIGVMSFLRGWDL